MKDTIQDFIDNIEESAFGRHRHCCLKKALPPLIAFYASFGLAGVKIAHRFLETLRRDIRALPDYSMQNVSFKFLNECSKFLPRNPEIPEERKR